METKGRHNLICKLIAVLVSLMILAGLIFSSKGLSLTAFAASGTVIGPYTITGGMRNIDYKLENDVLYILSDIPLTIANTDIDTASTVPIVVNADVNGNITLAGVNIAPTSAAAIDVSPATQSGANVIVTIADDTVNTLQGGSSSVTSSSVTSIRAHAGLQKQGAYMSAEKGKLCIRGEIKGNGQLNATGGEISDKQIGGAGIGGYGLYKTNGGTSVYSETSNIHISHCIVKAHGGTYGPGIGAGSCQNYKPDALYRAHAYSLASYLYIDDSNVAAYGGQYAAGIGTGSVRATKELSSSDWYSSSTSQLDYLYITDSTVNAVGGQYGAGVGTGQAAYADQGHSRMTNLVIDNSQIVAQGGQYAAGIGTGFTDDVNNTSGYSTTRVDSLSYLNSNIVVDGGARAAGIGTGALSDDSVNAKMQSSVSKITFESCNVTSNGGILGAGIGSGASGSTTITEISFVNSSVQAVGKSGAAGIGTCSSIIVCKKSSYSSSFYKAAGDFKVSDIVMQGSIISATSTYGGPGIGSAKEDSQMSNVQVSQGSLKAVGADYGNYKGANIGTAAIPVTSGSAVGDSNMPGTASADGTPIFPVDADGNNLYLAEIDNPTGGPIVIDGDDYPTKHFDETKIYAYLTDSFHTVTTESGAYAVNPRTGQTLPLPDVTAPTPVSNLVYNENPQTLIEAGETSNGTMKYALDKSGPWSTELPKATNADTYTVWYKSEGDNLTVASTNPESIEVTIAKAQLTFTDEQENSVTATDIVYEQSLADSSLTGTGPVDGQFVWADDTITPIVADSNTTAFNVLFKPTDINYDDYELTCTLQVSKKSFTFSDGDRNNLVTGNLVYGQNLSQSSISGTTPVAGSYRWVNMTLIPSVGATNNYAVEFVPADTDNYEISSVGDLHVIVNQADPVITAEQLQALRVSEIMYGQTLADSRITASANTPGRFVWASPTTAPTVSDSLQTSYTITFIPTDSVNYKTKNIYTKIKVNPAPFVLAESTINGVTVADITYEDTLADATIYGTVPQPGHFEWKTPATTPTVADSDRTLYTLLYVPDDINYTAAEFTKPIHVSKKAFTFTQLDVDAMSASDITYGQTIADSTITGTKPTAGRFEWDNPSTAPTVSGTNNFAFSFIPADTDNYETVSVGSLHVTVNPAILTTTGTGVAKGTYGKRYNELVVTGFTVKNGAEEVAGTWSLAGTDIPDIPSANKTAVFTPTANVDCYESLERLVAISITDELFITPANEDDVLVYGTDYTYSPGNPGLVILSSKPITVKNADLDTPTDDCIVIGADIPADITLAGVNINGDCALKIPDNCTSDIVITLAPNTTNILTSGSGRAGIEKNGDGEGIGKLTITGEGILTVTGGENAAGIGGGDGKNAANIEISGGGVTALAGTRGAGIGGGSGGDGSNIIISGGNVVATGSTGGSGIGGGYLGEGTDITISGGNLKATGGEVLSGGNIFTGAAIGSGVNIINGVTVQGEPCPITNGTETVHPLPLVVPGDVSVIEIDGVIHSAMGTDPTVYLTEGTHTIKIDGVTTTYIWSTEENKWLVSTVVTAPIPKQSLIANGTAQELVTAGSTNGGILMYSLAESGPYTTDIPTAVQAGTYTVWYKVVGNGAYTDVAPTSVQVVVNSATPSGGSTSSSRPSGGGSSSGSSWGSSSSSSLPAATPSFNDRTSSWTTIAKEIGKLNEGSSVAISLNGGTTAPAEVMEAIAENNLKSTFVIDSTFSWVIDGSTLEDPSIVDLTFSKISDVDTSTLVGTNGTQFKINNTNADTKLSVSFKKEHAGSFANVYRQSASGLEFISCSKVDAKGNVILPEISKKGKYAVMLQPYSDMPGDANNNGRLEVIDAMLILRHSLGILFTENANVIDINEDRYINAKDALAVLRRVLGFD